MRVFPTQPGAVPTVVFAPVLRELLLPPRGPTQSQLQAQSGVPSRTLYRILRHVDRSVSFEIVDALLTALDAIHRWHEPPLDQYLDPPPPREQLINPITPAQDAIRQVRLTCHHQKEHAR